MSFTWKYVSMMSILHLENDQLFRAYNESTGDARLDVRTLLGSIPILTRAFINLYDLAFILFSMLKTQFVLNLK